MSSFLQNIWYSAAEAPSATWQWFMGLKQEEWLIVLLVVCAAGFLCMLGFGARRI